MNLMFRHVNLSLQCSIVVVSALLLVGCSKSHDLRIDQIESISVAYLKDVSSLLDVKEFGSGSQELYKIKKWLKDNKEDWESYLVTEPVGEILISGDGFRLNVGESWVILDYEGHQLSKTISPVEFSFLRKKEKLQ